ncbi:MAG: leucyl aminopeptidase family protein [Actinobacteria bacterium]|jgi:leucyl aminopeptidase|nr:leucyl aminopeptidase family protein [Actinomycetota bacterium]NDH80512.1 leucyl aminopeptidase family protein [Actinomycetota bacterium]NDH98925.1 leucyl aminopeptidase family protein [Actinomycetota bacterium]NDI07222.1 leucyl aminopeptidase family protein [Actinomycetota bacterium]
MPYAQLNSISSRIEDIVSADAIAVGFVKSEEAGYELVGAVDVIASIEKYFEVDLLDEIAFFQPAGKPGEILEIPISQKATKSDRVFVIGLGDQSTQSHRLAAASLGRKLRGKKITVSTLLANTPDDLRAHAISTVLGSYTWTLKSDAKSDQPTFNIFCKNEKIIDQATVIATAVCRARDLVHTPSNIKNPLWMAQQAQKIAKEGKLTIKVLAGKELAQFGGLRAVGNSSPKPGPRFIEISYTPKLNGNKTPHVVLVGKGITFDTGGVSLKRPYDLMMAMKSDMAGASAVLNVVGAMPDLKPRVKVTALLMCAENALSGTSQRPSDVITHYGGTTVEVLDTDAEGRLVLADGLAYADAKLDPDYLLDIATLTGSATLGLGRQYGAMYTRDSKLAAQLFAAGESSGDRLWPMPLIDEYQDSLDSDIADFNHTADKGDYSAGSVTAALFLEKFTGQRKWVHLDVAGTARSENDAGESPKGGTGFGVRVLIDWIMSL